MKVTLLCIGKTDNKKLEDLIEEYVLRLRKYITFNIECILTPKNFGKLQPRDLKKAEGELILQKVSKGHLILLDEKGKQFTSAGFAKQVQKYMNAGHHQVYFVVGGAYGFSEEVYAKAHGKVALSEMTTTHQLIRLMFAEQIYRAYTILNNHPYHNQ